MNQITTYRTLKIRTAIYGRRYSAGDNIGRVPLEGKYCSFIVNLLPEEYEESNDFEKRHHINIQYGLESIDCVYVDSSDDKKELTDELHKHQIDNLKIKARL